MEARFQHAIDLADMDGRGFVPHSLRHSSVSHESHRLSLEANRRKHGHVYAATTQGYTHVEDEYVDDEIARAIDAQIRAAIGDKP
jgi:site-specific recombinase XerD